jgi:Ca2+/H+ antiporter
MHEGIVGAVDSKSMAGSGFRPQFQSTMASYILIIQAVYRASLLTNTKHHAERQQKLADKNKQQAERQQSDRQHRQAEGHQLTDEQEACQTRVR